MPELPDVEVFRRYLNSTALHQTIRETDVRAQGILEDLTPTKLQSQLKGRQLESTDRHGKYLFARLDNDDWIVFHFGMTGFLRYFQNGQQAPGHTRALFSFENGYHLAFVLQRKLGKIALTPNVRSYVKKQGLGPDALDRDFGLEDFKEALKGTRSSIKSALMDQERIAGIGNIYSDEILFQARLSPRTRASQLGNRSLEALFQAVKEVLSTAIDSQADPGRMPGHYLLPHREKEGRCPICQTEMKSEKIAGRTSYYCPHHQK